MTKREFLIGGVIAVIITVFWLWFRQGIIYVFG